MIFTKRIFDVVLALIMCFPLIPLVFLIGLVIKLTSPGPIFYWSDRVGRGNKIFKMPKFRSMKKHTPAVATDLLVNPADWLTPVGWFLRRYSLDELPQVWSVLKGDMSFVGPRPALFNQTELIALRTQLCVTGLRPGVTGWAQVNGRDELSISQKVQFDLEYLQQHSFIFDLKIMWLTLSKVISSRGVSH